MVKQNTPLLLSPMIGNMGFFLQCNVEQFLDYSMVSTDHTPI